MEAVSPLKDLRLRLHKTLDQVARQTEHSKQFIIRAEQGVFTDLPVGLISYYAEYLDLEINEEREKYWKFQRETRIKNYGALIEPWEFQDLWHPFINWRMASGIPSQAKVCTLFCVHPAVIYKLEKASMISLPDQLIGALMESGYSAETLENLRVAYAAFKDRQRQDLEVILGGE